jgi:hypothetical protein
MLRFISALVGVAALAAASAVPAAAAPITGNLNMYGDFKPLKSDNSSTNDLSLAAKIDFLPSGGGTGIFRTGEANGDLSAFAYLTGGTIKDFTFNPFASQTTFYTITSGGETLSFDLTGLTIDLQNSTFLNFSGTGTLHLTGFDDTPGVWNFSGQRSGSNSNATFSWSAGSSANEVPEPATLLLTSAGLLAVGFVRRRKA